jgi:hypothetical protein
MKYKEAILARIERLKLELNRINDQLSNKEKSVYKEFLEHKRKEVINIILGLYEAVQIIDKLDRGGK